MPYYTNLQGAAANSNGRYGVCRAGICGNAVI